MSDKIDELYDALKADGAVQKDRANFRHYMLASGKQGYQNRKALYDALKADGAIQSPTYEEFRDRLGLKSKGQVANASEEAAKRAAYDAHAKNGVGAVKPTDVAKDVASGAALRRGVEQARQATVQGFENATDYAAAKRGGQVAYMRPVKDNADVMEKTYSGVIPGQGAYNPDVEVKTYVTAAGNEYGTPEDASKEQAQIAAAEDYANVEKRLQDAYKRKDELQHMLDERAASIQESAPRANALRYMGRGQGAFISDINRNAGLADAEYRKLLAAQHATDREIKALEAVKANVNGGTFVGGLARGFWDAVGNYRTWDAGIGDLLDAGTLAGAAAEKPRTKEEKRTRDLLMRSEAGATDAEQNAQANAGRGYTWGGIAGSSLPFALDILTGRGMTEGIARGGRAAGVAAARKLIQREGKHQVLRSLGRGFIKNTGIALGDVAAAGALSTTISGAKTAADVLHRNTGDVTVDMFDKDGELRFEGGKSMGRSIYEGVANATIENYTERLGEHINFGKPGGLFGKAGDAARVRFAGTGLKNVSEFLARVNGSKFVTGVDKLIKKAGSSKAVTDANKLMKMGGFDGYPQEVIEEEVGIPLHAIFDGGAEFGDLLDGKQQADIVGGMAVSMAAMGGAAMALNAARYGGDKASLAIQHFADMRKLNAADAFAGGVLGDKWAGLKEQLNETDNKDFGNKMAEVIYGKKYSEDEKEAAWNYMQALLTMRGHNLGQAAADRGGEVSEDMARANELYTEGYSMNTPDARNAVYAQNMEARSAFADAMKDARALPEGANTDEEIAEAVAVDPRYSDKQRAAATALLAAKHRYDGMWQRANDDISAAAESERAAVGRREKKGTGEIQSATMRGDDGTDKTVYIIDGDVAVTEDGAVNATRSDKTIVVMDDEGQTYMVPAEFITSLGASVPTAEAQDAAADAVSSQMVQQLVTDMMGPEPAATAEETPAAGSGAQTAAETPMQTEEPAGQATAERPAGYEPAPGERVMVDDGNGGLVGGTVTGVNPDGGYFVRTDEPVNGRVEQPFAADAIAPAENVQAQADSSAANNKADSGAAPNAEAQEAPKAEQDATPDGEDSNGAGGRGTALGRIPSEQVAYGKGKTRTVHHWEEAPAEDTYDALLEVYHGSSDRVDAVAKKKADTARKAIADAEKKRKEIENEDDPDMAAERAGEYDELEGRIAALTAQRRYWEQVRGVPEARKAAAEAAAKHEADAVAAREGVEDVPEWNEDTPKAARERGYRRQGGHRYDRQGTVKAVKGKAVNVKFSGGVSQRGHVALVDADDLQPSHEGGQANVLHFLPEAQPKQRTDAASTMSAHAIARNVNPEEVTGSAVAYTGAPSVNERGEAIQGNNRLAGLKEMYRDHPEQAQKYKQYLTDHAQEFGLTAEDVERMEKPVLVNVLPVTDARAIELGQYDDKDITSGGKERIKPGNTAAKMGDDMRTFAGMLLDSPDEEATLAQLTDRNGARVLDWMARKGYITATQHQSALNAKGELTDEAKSDLRGVLYNSIFRGGNERLEEMFAALPAKAQKAILSTAYRDFDSPESERMLGDLQASIMAYWQLMQDERFARANNFGEARRAIEDWKRELTFDAVTGASVAQGSRFTNFALYLVAMYKGSTQKAIQETLNGLYDLVQGRKAATLFEAADTRKRTLPEAVKELLNIEYDGRERSDAVDGDVAASPSGRRGGQGNAGRGREGKEGEAPARPAGRAGGMGEGAGSESSQGANGGRGRGDNEDTRGRQSGDLAQAEEGYKLSDEIDENGRRFVYAPDGNLAFGHIGKKEGLPDAPILLSEGIITDQATGDGYGLMHIEARHGNEIRNAGFSSVLDFIEEVARNYDTIKKGAVRAGHQTYLIQLTDKHNNTLMVELSNDGSYWNINTAGIFKSSYGKNKEVVYSRHTTANQSAETSEVSQDAEQSGTTAPSSMNTSTQQKAGVHSAPSAGKVSEKTEPAKEEGAKKSAAGGEAPKQQRGEGKAVTSEEAALRDALSEVMRQSGIPVIEDEAEGQMVLDMARAENAPVRTESKRTKALPTASVQEEHQPTVVDSANGAKVLQNLDIEAQKYEKNDNNRSRTFIGDIAAALGAKREGSASEYATFETKNGKIVTIRLGNHNARVSTFDNHGEGEGISIVVSAKKGAGVQNDGTAHVVEYYYDAIKLRKADGKPLAEIVRGVKQALYSGEYKDTTGLAERQEVNVHYLRSEGGRVLGFTVGGRVYIDPKAATAETPIHEYTHLWAAALRRVNPEEWGNVVGILKKDCKALWDEVKARYPELESEDEIAEEVLAHYSGRRGAERLREKQAEVLKEKGGAIGKAAAVAAIARMREALSRFWQGVCDMLHVRFTTAEEVADKALSDMLRGVDPRGVGREEAEIVAKAKADGTYMKAPNGKPTKLTERQWVQVRTKAFKQWFGDWENDAEHASKVVDENGEPLVVDGVYVRSDKNFVARLNKAVDDARSFVARIREIEKRTGTKYPSMEFAYTDEGWEVLKEQGNFPAYADYLIENLLAGKKPTLRVAFRYGGIPKNGLSRNWADDFNERGVSVVGSVSKLNTNVNAIYDLAYRSANDPNPTPYNVIGGVDFGDKGSDGEMLLNPAMVIGRSEDIGSIAKSATDNVGTFDSSNADIRYQKDRANRRDGRLGQDIEAVNARFNERLDELVANPQQKDRVLHLGRAGAVLRAAGVADAEIVLEFDKLQRKSKANYKSAHPYDAKEVKDLPKAINAPIAVFERADNKNGRAVILTELKRGDLNFVAVIQARKTNRKGGVLLEINEITTLYPKEVRGVIDWLNNGRAKYIDKEKALNFIEALPTHMGTTITSQELKSAAKVVRDFENPAVETEENAALAREGGVQLSRTNPRLAMRQAVEAMAEMLNLGNVDVVEDGRALAGRRATAKGWYDPRTGRITVVPGNHTGVKDVIETMLHEAVAHYGLRQLVGGERMDDFLDGVYAAATADVRARIDALAGKYGGNLRTATEEYLAGLAEGTAFESMRPSLWERVKQLFREMLAKVGLKAVSDKLARMDDGSLRYILWRSYRNLQEGGRRGVFERMADAAERVKLGLAGGGARRPADWGREGALTTMRRVAGGEDTDLLLRDGEGTARTVYNRVAQSNATIWREAWQDSMINVRNLQDAVLQETGGELHDYEDAYMAENNSHGIMRAKSEIYQRKYFEPLLKEVRNVANVAKVGLADVVNYMMAKHGLERNEKFAERDADAAFDKYRQAHPNGGKTWDDFYAEYRKRDYSGLTSLYGTDNVKDAEDAARNAVAFIEQRTSTDELWARTNAATKRTLREAYEGGLMSRDTYDRVKDMFSYYIPLRGYADATAEDLYSYVESPTGTHYSPTLHKAKGRWSEADNPLAYIGSMAVSAITQSEKNKVKQTFLRFVENNPTNLVTVSEMWYRNIGTEQDPEWVEDVAAIPEDASADDVDAIVKQHEADMQALEAQGLATKKRSGLKLGVPVKKSQAKEHHVEVLVNGKKYVLYINGNPRAAQALNGSRARNAAGNAKESALVGRVSRWLAQAYTSLSPNFTVSNLLRDYTMATAMTFVNEGAEYAGRFQSNILMLGGPARMFGLMRWYNGYTMQDEGQRPALGALSETQRYFYEFMTRGGETGYTSLEEIEDYKEDMDKAFKNLDRGVLSVKKAGDNLVRGIEMMNRCIEDMTRFATYMASRQVGKSVARSVEDAKNITLNFNRKGSGEKGNATVRNLQIFVNPAIQAIQNVTRAVLKHPVRLGIAGGFITAMGFAAPMITMLLWGTFGDDGDDWNAIDEYWKLPTWQRRNNYVIWIPGTEKFLMIPLGQEFRVLHGMGETVATVASGHGDDNVALEVAAQASDLLPLNPGGNGGNPLVNFAPSVTQPLLQVGFNKDFTGKPIWKESGWNKYEPAYEKAYAGTPRFLVSISAGVNELTGGNAHAQGSWERTMVGQYANNPAVVDHLAKGYMGGIYSFISQTASTGQALMEGNTPNVREVPIVNRVLTTPMEKEQSGKPRMSEQYYDVQQEVMRKDTELNGFKRDAMRGDRKALAHWRAYLQSEAGKLYLRRKAMINGIDQLRRGADLTTDPERRRAIEHRIDSLENIVVNM